MHTASIWQGTAGETVFPPLQGRVAADVAIIGGGITGVTLAMLLAEAGRSVVLVEARRIGEGSTGNSTGNLYEVLSEQLYTIGERWDRSVMGEVADSRREAMALVERVAGRLGDCGFSRCPLYLYATAPAQIEVVEKEYEAALQLGLAARLEEGATPVPSLRALILDNQAQIHPLAYVQRLAQQIASPQCRIFEQSPAVAIDEKMHSVHTAQGSIRARDIVLATHTPKGIYLVQAEMVPRREYGIGLRLASGNYPDGIFWGMGDYRHSVRSLRAGNDHYLILVGEDHKTGQHDAADAFARLEGFARRKFDVGTVDFRWSAQHYHPADGLPYIGASHGSEVHIATGFGTNGLTWGTLAATVIADRILGRDNRWAHLYRANRLLPMKAAKGALEENLSVAKSFIRDYTTRPQTALDGIPVGGGALVEVDGQKLAVHRDESGTLSALSPVCTHMKCMVHWNGAERTWDCPCHGSRFDVEGRVIEGPALAPLARKPLPE